MIKKNNITAHCGYKLKTWGYCYNQLLDLASSELNITASQLCVFTSKHAGPDSHTVISSLKTRAI